MQNDALQKVRAKMYARMTEIILGVLLTTAIAFFAYTLNSQAAYAERLRACETTATLNRERIDVVKEALEKSEASIARQLELLMKRVDQRCDTLESILSLIASPAAGQTAEEDF